MKKILQISLIITMFICSISPVFAKSTSVDTSETFTVYNSDNIALATFNTLEEAEQFIRLQNNEKINPGQAWEVLKAIIDWTGRIITLITVYDEISNPQSWLNQRFVFDNTTDAEVIVYSNDGKVSNPYPPNSYEGWYWEKNNFYYVLRMIE